MSFCERCGRRSRLQLVEIEGARMYVCPDCSRFGKAMKEEKDVPSPVSTVLRPKPERSAKPDALTKRSKELAEDYPRRIQRAREKKGWSREELGRKLSERVSIITKLENGEMRPPDSLIKKLERTLEIELMEYVEEIHMTAGAGSRGMTLADFIVYKDR
ncbi:MAG: TIGR00270 family protein [Candidatus Thermoplasmatota archaeon]|nr:TIGR00270 family protein [Candidatus Thermoplasmatota archaeon]